MVLLTKKDFVLKKIIKWIEENRKHGISQLGCLKRNGDVFFSMEDLLYQHA